MFDFYKEMQITCSFKDFTTKLLQIFFNKNQEENWLRARNRSINTNTRNLKCPFEFLEWNSDLIISLDLIRMGLEYWLPIHLSDYVCDAIAGLYFLMSWFFL